MLGPWSRAEAQFCHVGVGCLHHLVQPGGRTLHQSERHLRQPGPAAAVPRPHRICRRVRLHGRWRLWLGLLLILILHPLSTNSIGANSESTANHFQVNSVSYHKKQIYCLMFVCTDVAVRCFQLIRHLFGQPYWRLIYSWVSFHTWSSEKYWIDI